MASVGTPERRRQGWGNEGFTTEGKDSGPSQVDGLQLAGSGLLGRRRA